MDCESSRPATRSTPLFVILNLFALSFAKTTYNLLLSMFLFYAFMVAAIGVLISGTFAVRSWIFHAANGALSAWTLV